MADGLHAIVEHYSRYGWFLAIWSIPVALLAIAATMSTRSPSAAAVVRNRDVVATIRTPAAVASIVALVAFLCAYAYAIIAHEDLVGIDYALLTAKRFVDMPLWPDIGRFYPLAFQEYNALALVGKSAALYHAFSLIELAIVVACVFRVLDETPIWLRCIAVPSLLVAPSVQRSFFGLVYPERDLLFWLAVWLVSIQSFGRTKRRSAWCTALLATQFILYYKETSFVLVATFAAARLALAAWADRGTPRRGGYSGILARHSLEWSMLALCALFLGIYAAAIVPHVRAAYGSAGSVSASAAAFVEFVRSDPVLDAMGIVLAIRVVALAKRPLDAVWDPLAAGAITYALAFMKLGLTHDYYLAPTDFLAGLYLTRVGYDALRGSSRTAVAGALAVVALLFLRNLREDAYTVLVRKQFVAGNAQLANFLTSYSSVHDGAALPLFFMQAGGFQLMELSSFLQYKGLRAAGASGDSPSHAAFVMKSAHRYPDDRCHEPQRFRCEYAAAPRAGDLLLLLPGHSIAPGDLAALRANAREVMHFQPRPASLERALSALVPDERLAELAPDAYVFEYAPSKP